jgi:hypothetical protein
MAFTVSKHLFKTAEGIKTYNFNTHNWEVVCSVGNETQTIFENQGVDDITQIPIEKLHELSESDELLTWVDDTNKTSLEITVEGTKNYLRELDNPKILAWADDTDNTKQVKTTAAPYGQLVLPNDDLLISDVDSFDSFSVTSNISGNGIIRIIVSVDSGATWKVYNGGWQDITTDKYVVKDGGMNISTFNGLTSTDWNNLRGTSDTIRFGYYLEVDNSSDIAETDVLEMQADMKGTWKKCNPNDYDYEYAYNNKIVVKLLVDGSYKINY